jgi:hypothetical protein
MRWKKMQNRKISVMTKLKNESGEYDLVGFWLLGSDIICVKDMSSLWALRMFKVYDNLLRLFLLTLLFGHLFSSF